MTSNNFPGPALPIQLNRGKYTEPQSTGNAIRYISRTRANETRADELLLWGTSHGYIYPKSPEIVISEFLYVQKYYKQKGSQICHYVLLLSLDTCSRMNNDIYTIGNYAVACCQYFLYTLGHQSCFAIHNSATGKLHIHFILNATNYWTGRKLRQYHKEVYHTIEKPMLDILEPFIYATGSIADF